MLKPAPLALLLCGCLGAALVYVVGSAEEAECVHHLPPGVKQPAGGALRYVCREDAGTAYFELIGTDCTDVPSPPASGSWRCELDGGTSVWVPEGEVWPN